MKTDEANWNKHLVSTSHLQLCKDNKDKIAEKFSEKIFNANPTKSIIFILKIEKSHEFWQLHFVTELPREKSSIF